MAKARLWLTGSVLTMGLICLISGIGFAGGIFEDRFDKDTTGDYEYGYSGDALPNKTTFSWDSSEKYLDIVQGDNYVFLMSSPLGASLTEGTAEIRFHPTQSFPSDGDIRVGVASSDLKLGPGFDPEAQSMYLIGLSQEGNYGGWMRKVDGGANIAGAEIPKNETSYSLNEWHTIKIEFAPGNVKGYLDDEEVMSFSDPTKITVDTVFVCLEQQHVYLDDFIVTSPEAAVVSSGKLPTTWASIKAAY